VGAASFRPLTDGTGWRFTNVRATETYLRTMAHDDLPPLAECERRTLGELENEAVWLSLRTAAGLSRSAHEQRYGLDPLLGREEQVERCVAAGWLLVAGDRWQLTDLGWSFADEVAARLWRG
jgi:coproporphyrinogen III oxidase-like Fe-S oxidoreductase